MIAKIKEIFQWRGLLFNLALKDLKVKYRRATGGFAWMLVLPLTHMVMFISLRAIFKIEIENYPLLLLSGLLPWNFFSVSLNSAANSIVSNANLIKKAYFPREILVISNNITNLINFIFSLVVLCIFSLFFKVFLFPALLWLPLVIFIQIILIIGISLFVVSLNTIYRETQFIMGAILWLWFTATPIVYPIEMIKNTISPALFFLYKLNPMTGIICAYQNMFLYGATPNIELLFFSIFSATLFFILGIFSFRYYEFIFVDVV